MHELAKKHKEEQHSGAANKYDARCRTRLDVHALKKRSYSRKVPVCAKLNQLFQKADTAC